MSIVRGSRLLSKRKQPVFQSTADRANVSLSDDFSLSDFLPYQATVLGSRLSSLISSVYGRKFNVTLPEWRVLVHLNEEEKISVRDIYKRIELDKVSISRAAKNLEAKGFVFKKTDESDRRLVSLSLTEKGKELIHSIVPVARQYEKQICSSLSAEEEDELRSLIKKLLLHLPEHKENSL